MGKDSPISDPVLLADYSQAVDIMWLSSTGALVFCMYFFFLLFSS